MKRALFLLFLLLAGSCAAPVANGPGAGGSMASDQGPRLDIPDVWLDPEADFTPLHERADTRDPRVNPDAPTIAIVGGTILTAAGKRFEKGTILLSRGRIEHVGESSVNIPPGARVIDATDKYLSPGIIDTHSHLGVYASPRVTAHEDGNEVSAPATPEARAEYGFWPQDPGLTRALAGGVTAALILPGSANFIGGRGLAVVMRPGRTVDEVRFPGAPPTIKMACGENPKRYHGDKGGPRTRMGVYAAFREKFLAAREYGARWSAYERKRAIWLERYKRAAELSRQARATGKGDKWVKSEPAPEPPPRDPGLDTLAGVLRGQVLVQIHCYRADELREMLAIADEMGFAIRSFHHALEAYKVRDLLVDHNIAINTWADWWGFKMEAFDGIPENAALFTESGGRAVIHSDSPIGIQRLNQEAAKAMYAGRHAGIDISEDQALRWVTANPAWVMGIDQVTGTLEAGKRADVVIWSAHPLSVYAKAEVVIQGGEVAYEREKGRAPTDFELGNSAQHIDTPRGDRVAGGAR